MERGGEDRVSPPRVAVFAALVSAAAPGLLFAPVFGVGPLLIPLVLVVLSGFVVAEASRHRAALAAWRPVLTVLVGLLALTEALLWDTTAGGLPTGATLRALAGGVTESWQLTLQSTWPAHPVAELLLFVPLATLAAGVLAVELVSRPRRPLLAVLPGLAVLILSQAYVALTGPQAVLVAVGFATVAAVLVRSADRRPPEAGAGRAAWRPAVAWLLVVPTLLLAGAGAVLGAVADPLDAPAYSLRDKQFTPLPPDRVASPLDELNDHLRHGEELVFRYTSDVEVDRWRLAVLDQFDGVTWRPGVRPRRLGTRLPPAASVTVPVTEHRASVEYPSPTGPWLPSQPLPASVAGVAPLVDETTGTLLVPGNTGRVDYELSWWEPRIEAQALGDAAVDPAHRVGDVGEVPAEIFQLARQAVGDTRPAFQTALVLERYLRENYTRATGTDLPSGNGWPQLSSFLLETKRGTTAQFATAYVVLARIVGVPARVAVGYRADGAGTDVAVRRGDVLAWPEVAVDGVGWVPLDPAGAPNGAAATPKGLAEATARARENLPAPEQVRDPQLPGEQAADRTADDQDRFTVPVVPILAVVAGLAVAWVLGVPLARLARGVTRRRRRGAPAVVAAWWEARDLLRAHGMACDPGMTVRDLAKAASGVADGRVGDGLAELARSVDVALWSRSGPAPATVDQAWSAVRVLRRGLAGRPLRARVRAALNVRSLFRP